LPENEKRNTKAILHGIGHALHGFTQDITEEPLPQALTELLKRLEQAPAKRYGKSVAAPGKG
jgi:hypothetical protein